MAKLVMERQASDNPYLHRDFHVTGEQGLRYLGEKMGDNAVTEFLTIFTKRYYKPLIDAMKEKGLSAYKEHLETIYNAEDALDVLDISLTSDSITVSVSECPAIRFMKSINYTPCRWYGETTTTVCRAIADEADFGFHLDYYEPETGKARYTFFRRCL